MSEIIRIGMDTSKSVFKLHGVDAAEQPVLRQEAAPARFAGLFRTAAGRRRSAWKPAAGTHYWARELTALGHEVKLLPPQHVKPYVRRGQRTTGTMPMRSARR